MDRKIGKISIIPELPLCALVDLSKRDLFAAMAMQGFIASGGTAWSNPRRDGKDERELADHALRAADALVEALRTAPGSSGTRALTWEATREAVLNNIDEHGVVAWTRLRSDLGFAEAP